MLKTMNPVPIPKPKALLTPENHPILTQKIPFPCPTLTRFLAGGIPLNSLTELVSESAAGKTQLCLHLLLSASSSLFLYSEFPFPLRRLLHLSLSPSSLDHIFLHPLHYPHHLLHLLLNLPPFLLSHPNLNLIIIDSIAALFRPEFSTSVSDLKRRSHLFFKISAQLRHLAEKFNLAVVITNQVVDYIENNCNGNNIVRMGNVREMWSGGRRVSPALGLGWANCVNTRLFLSRWEEVSEERSGFVEEDGRESLRVKTKRMIEVVFAPHLPPSQCEFVIRRDGVFGVPGTIRVL